MSDFIPKHLSHEQIRHALAQYLQAAEARVLEAWVAHQCNAHDAGLKLRYEEAVRDMEWLEAEEKRWLQPAGEKE